MSNNTTITPHQDINEVLLKISNGLTDALGENLVGLYLFEEVLSAPPKYIGKN